jgi:hypothetical protein
MKDAANDNQPLLIRHPRLLAPVRDGDCNRQRDTDEKRKEDTPEDTDSELAVIETRIKFLNWIEFALGKKRAAANDGEVAGRFAS